MRRIIKADNEYNRLPNTIFFCIILIPVVVNSFLGNMEGFLAGHILVFSMVNGLVIGTEYVKARRIRLLAGLPLPVRTLGIYRLYGIMLGWLLLMALLFLSSLIGRRGHLGPDYAWWILTKIGSMYIMFGCMSLVTNLYYCAKETVFNKTLMRWAVGPILMLIGMIGGPILYFFSIPGPNAYSNEFFIALSEILLTFSGSFGLFLFGLLFLVLDFYVFERRRSFTDDTGWPF